MKNWKSYLVAAVLGTALFVGCGNNNDNRGSMGNPNDANDPNNTDNPNQPGSSTQPGGTTQPTADTAYHGTTTPGTTTGTTAGATSSPSHPNESPQPR